MDNTQCSSSGPTLDDLRSLVGRGPLIDFDWRRFVSPDISHVTLTRWADALERDPRLTGLVALLRAHAAARQHRFSIALTGFEDARRAGTFTRTDCLACASVYRATGDHERAVSLLAHWPVDGPDDEIFFWQAVSEMHRGRLDKAAGILERTPAASQSTRMKWFADYLRVRERRLLPRTADGPLAGRYHAIEGSEHASVVFALTDYKTPDLDSTSCNIGDYLQSLALARHVARFWSSRWTFSDLRLAPIIEGLSRHRSGPARTPVDAPVHVTLLDRDTPWAASTLYPGRVVWTVLHGWYHEQAFDCGCPFPLPPSVKPLFLSLHLHSHRILDQTTLAFLKPHQPIGCRDWSTVYWLLNAGVEAFFSGCLTTTWPQALGARTGRALYVDSFPPPRESAPQIHHETESVRLADHATNLRVAQRLLQRYASATHVTTSRLHGYLPCLALGTPTTFQPHNPADRRFDGLLDLESRGVAAMADRLTGLLDAVLPMVLSGEDESVVRDVWCGLTRPLVEEAEARMGPPGHSMQGRMPVLAKSPERPLPRHSPAGRKVTVVMAFDRSYAKHAPPLIKSILAHTTVSVNFVFLVRQVTDLDLEEPVTAAGGRVAIVPMDSFLSKTFVRLAGGTTLSTMDRLFLPRILPGHDRIVYIDTDAVVLGDMAELATFEPSARGIAARPNPARQLRCQADLVEYAAGSLCSRDAADLRRFTAASGQLDRPSFNAGVLVLGLARLRALDFTTTVLGLVQRFGLQDEQALNVYSGGEFRELPSEWNAMPYVDACDGAKLMHWAGHLKPWMDGPIRYADRWREFGGVSSPADTSESAGFWGRRESHSYSWEERARRVAGLIAPNSSVLDLGCGRMFLRRFLPAGCRYVPADLPRWSEDVIVVDLDQGQFPGGQYDMVVILNVLEYLKDPLGTLRGAREHGSHAIVSYAHPIDGRGRDQRRARRWLNDLSVRDLHTIFAASGWSVRSSSIYSANKNDREVIYLLD